MDHMHFESDREDPKYEKWGEPSLTEMAEKAIGILKKSEKGYFLLVEGNSQENTAVKGTEEQGFCDSAARQPLKENVRRL